MAVDLLDDVEGPRERRAHECVLIRQVDVRRVDEEHRLDVPLHRALHHPHRVAGVLKAHYLGEALRRNAPALGDVVSPLLVLEPVVEGQAPRETTGEPLTHRVRLTRHGEGTAAGPADVAGERHQVDEAHRVVLTVDVLVVADAPERQDAAAAALPAGDGRLGPLRRHLAQIRRLDHRDLLHLLRRVPRAARFDVLLPARRVLAEEVHVASVLVLGEQHVGDGVVDGDVAVDRGEVVRVVLVDALVALHRAGAARIHDEGRDVVLLLVVRDAPEDDRVRAARVVTPVGHHVGELDVLVRGGRRVAAEGLEVPGHRGGHAHPRVGLDGVRPEDALHEEVLEVLPLDGELPRAVERDGVAPVLLDDPDDLVDDQLLGLLPRRLAPDVVTEGALGLAHAPGEDVGVVAPDQGLGQPVDVDRLGRGEALDALEPGVGRMLRVGLHADDPPVLGLDQRAAPDAAVGALRRDVVRHRVVLGRCVAFVDLRRGGGRRIGHLLDGPVVLITAIARRDGDGTGRGEGTLEEPTTAKAGGRRIGGGLAEQLLLSCFFDEWESLLVGHGASYQA